MLPFDLLAHLLSSYDPMTNSWHEVAPMATSRVAAGVAVVNRFLYVVGGYNGERLRSMEKFYPERNEWQSCPPMSTPRSGAGTLTVSSISPIFYCHGWALNAINCFAGFAPSQEKC